MNIKYAKDSILTLLEVVTNKTILLVNKKISKILQELIDNGYKVNYATQTVLHNGNTLILGTVNEKDIHKYMGLEVQYMYLPSSLDSELSKWMITKLRGNNLFIYDDWV